MFYISNGRHGKTRAVKRTLRRLKAQFFRALDIIVSAVVICFLAPVFAVIAIVSVFAGSDDDGMDSVLTSLGLGQLPQLFQVLTGEMSLFN
jgi:lipopolysaccharide/colanic/teichoic acid biosynthesis glycosyltransferase